MKRVKEKTVMGRFAWMRVSGVLWFLWCLFSSPAQAICHYKKTPLRPDSRYEEVLGIVHAGSQVRDKVTGLVWQRCVVGMVWDGHTCTGVPSDHTWFAALDAARHLTDIAALTGEDVKWRVPSRAELYSLVERACYNPAINTTWFPATPAEWTLSFSSEAQSAWLVSFYYPGDNGGGLKDGVGRVRLVRAAD